MIACRSRARYGRRLNRILRQVVASYGYSEVRMPIVEQTHLFKRAIGEVTDVVEKRCTPLKIATATA